MDKSSFTGLVVGVGGILPACCWKAASSPRCCSPRLPSSSSAAPWARSCCNFPLPVVGAAFRRLVQVFFEPKLDPAADGAATGGLRQQGAAEMAWSRSTPICPHPRSFPEASR